MVGTKNVPGSSDIQYDALYILRNMPRIVVLHKNNLGVSVAKNLLSTRKVMLKMSLVTLRKQTYSLFWGK